MPAGGPPIPKFPARGSRPKTENKGFAGSRARTVLVAGPPTPKFPARSSCPETENKGLAGSRARTVSAAEPPPLEFPARGSRPKTETGETSANHAGRRASNPEIPGSEFAPENRNRGDEREPCRSPGLQPRNSRPRGSRPKTETGETSANHAGHRARPVSIGPIPLPPAQPKNAGRQPGVSPYPLIFLSSYPLIRVFIPADSGRFPRILPGTLSAAEALLRCPLCGWLPHSAEAPDRAGTSAGGTNRCGRSDRN